MRGFNNKKVLGGIFMGDYDTHRTLSAGPDPQDPSRVLIRKVVKVSDKTWCYEETSISPSTHEGGQPTVNTQLYRLGWFDLMDGCDD